MRLVYERFKAALTQGGVRRQGLLIPEIVTLEPHEVSALEDAAPELGSAAPRWGEGIHAADHQDRQSVQNLFHGL